MFFAPGARDKLGNRVRQCGSKRPARAEYVVFVTDQRLMPSLHFKRGGPLPPPRQIDLEIARMHDTVPQASMIKAELQGIECEIGWKPT
jgi:hypothetical protein